MEKNINIEELVLEALAELGFVTEDQGDGVYAFETGVANIVYQTSEDKRFLRFILPFVLSLDDISEEAMNKAIQLTNDNMKYVKAYLDDRDCFLAYERMLFDWDTDHLQPIVEHMIDCLNYTKMYVHSLFEDDKSQEADDDTDNEDNNE